VRRGDAPAILSRNYRDDYWVIGTSGMSIMRVWGDLLGVIKLAESIRELEPWVEHQYRVEAGKHMGKVKAKKLRAQLLSLAEAAGGVEIHGSEDWRAA
jgi:hypothetical protein